MGGQGQGNQGLEAFMTHITKRFRDLGHKKCNTWEETRFSGKVMRGLTCRKRLSDKFRSVGWL